MTASELQSLTRGDRVQWVRQNQQVTGTVTTRSGRYICIHWDDGYTAKTPILSADDWWQFVKRVEEVINPPAKV